jgi:hypothetical protein
MRQSGRASRPRCKRCAEFHVGSDVASQPAFPGGYASPACSKSMETRKGRANPAHEKSLVRKSTAPAFMASTDHRNVAVPVIR